ncbi:MAG: hypothetical protein AMXMBFR56_65810 [Polyangiaceae bacterium]
MSRRDIICRRELKTRACSVAQKTAKTYEHAVTLELTGKDNELGMPEALREKYSYRWILRIEGTGASWYMSTLLHADTDGREKPRLPGSIMSIDFGQGWYCENFDEVFAEALGLI